MKTKLILSALAVFAAAQTASGVIISADFGDPDGSGSFDVTFTGFLNGAQGSIDIGNGGTLAYDVATIVQVDTNGDGALPSPNSIGNHYLSVKATGEAIFAFAGARDLFAFQWGSIDDYNTITFTNGLNLVGEFTGSDITNPDPANGNQGIGGSAYVTFSDLLFDKVVLTSSTNSFEIDNVGFSSAVPDGGATVALFGMAVLCLQGVRRFASKK